MAATMSSKRVVIAFDLYGTLLSTSSIAKKLAEHFPDKAEAITSTWRTYQLEYTWRLNSMDQYQPFSEVTHNALLHALRTHSVALPLAATAALMKSYDSLSTFPDVPPALSALASHPNISPVIFSNGTSEMVSNSINHSASLSPYKSCFEKLVSVHETRKFKPDPKVYRFLAEEVGKKVPDEMGEIWLVSSNPFDIVGARAVGMKTAWVDREGRGWIDALVPLEEGQPSVIVNRLEEAIDAVMGGNL